MTSEKKCQKFGKVHIQISSHMMGTDREDDEVWGRVCSEGERNV